MAEAAAPAPRSSQVSFLHNVAWGWLGVGVNIVVSLVMAPLLIRRLGVDQYGLWVLLFSAVEYLRMLDFGFRAATVNACARFRARKDWEGVNRTIATAAVYFLVIGIVCCATAIGLRDVLIDALNVPPQHQAIARTLVLLIALSVSFRLILSPFTSALEAFQRYDLVNQAYISALVLRSTGSISLLLLGYGLVEIATVIMIAQIGENVLTIISVRRVVPAFRVSASLVRTEVLTQLFRYGRHSAVWVIAQVLSLQVPNTVIGFLLGPVAVGFFALPLRLLLYVSEALTKVSDVTSSVTAELDETRSTAKVWRLAVLTNRNSLALFMPAAIFLAVYSMPLLTVWISSEVAANSGPLIPVMLINFVLAVAGQHNAGAILLGQGKHARYAYANVLELILSTIGLLLVVPRFGILGAAWVLTIAELLTRGVYLAVLTCRLNGFALREYVAAIYARPLLTAVPVLLGAVALRETVWAGSGWLELIAAALVIAGTYFGIALFSVVEHEHRQRLRTWLLPSARAH
jgi:O-antigen/teichoic acid export membrane protein